MMIRINEVVIIKALLLIRRNKVLIGINKLSQNYTLSKKGSYAPVYRCEKYQVATAMLRFQASAKTKMANFLSSKKILRQLLEALDSLHSGIFQTKFFLRIDTLECRLTH